MNKKFC